MKRFTSTGRHGVMLAMFFGVFLASPALAPAQAPVNINNCKGSVEFATTPPTLLLEGTASHLGRFVARGEVVFGPGEQPDTMVATGPVVFRASNGDLLVGGMTWTLSTAAADKTRTATIHFRWSDFVTFSDGTVITNTGRFVARRPPGAVVTTKSEPVPTADPKYDGLLIRLLISIFRG